MAKESLVGLSTQTGPARVALDLAPMGCANANLRWHVIAFGVLAMIIRGTVITKVGRKKLEGDAALLSDKGDPEALVSGRWLVSVVRLIANTGR